jgi:molybdopterin-biosynthesis enzyme MoeA-like protein
VNPTACALLIGDELLTGKVRDENGHHLANVLRRRGIRLLEIVTVGDELSEIGAALHRLLGRAPLLFTSGGVGPTHDDRTLEAIALATGRPLERNATMEALVRQHWGARVTDAALRMADLPRGTVLRAESGWPVFRLELDRHEADDAAPGRIYVLPGVPGLFRSKLDHLEAIDGELPSAPGWHVEVLYTVLEESRLAAHLDAVLDAHPGVVIGSYPRWVRRDDGRVDMHVRVTLEGESAARPAVVRAREALQVALGPDLVLDGEPAS